MIPFIINLETSKDRRDDMIKQMYSINYPYTFIKAVDGRQLTEIEYQEEISQTLGRYCTKSRVFSKSL